MSKTHLADAERDALETALSCSQRWESGHLSGREAYDHIAAAIRAATPDPSTRGTTPEEAEAVAQIHRIAMLHRFGMFTASELITETRRALSRLDPDPIAEEIRRTEEEHARHCEETRQRYSVCPHGFTGEEGCDACFTEEDEHRARIDCPTCWGIGELMADVLCPDCKGSGFRPAGG